MFLLSTDFGALFQKVLRVASSANSSIESVDVAIKPDEVAYPGGAVFLAHRLGFPVSNTSTTVAYMFQM
jgi:hypothetical protein